MAFADMVNGLLGRQRGTDDAASNGNGRRPGTRGVDIPYPEMSSEEEAAVEGGLYDIVKKTNFWFNRELYQIEQQARGEGAEWAAKGLPHPSMTRDDHLPVEQTLLARCRETYRQWIERVRTKVQDAIEAAGQDVTSKMVALRFAIRTLETTELDVAAKRREATEMREKLRERAIPFGYRQLLRKTWAMPVLGLLIIVEFVANFPVFRILLPMSAQLAELSQQLTRAAVNKGLLTGAYHFLQDIALRPEAAAVAFIVVLATVVVADMFGISMRPLVALSGKEHPGAAVGIRRHRRQHAARVAMAGTGIVVILTSLFIARGQLPETAMSRVAVDSARVATLEAQLNEALVQRRTGVGAISIQVRDAKRTLELRRDEAAYAQTVQRSNLAILLLNIAIVLAAACVGYSHTHEDLMDELTEDPRYVELRETISRLAREAVEQRQIARTAVGDAKVGISTVRHLQSTKPLEDWPAKQERLQSAIQIFRAENARLRMLDPGDIAAFQVPARIDFPPLPHEPFRAPIGFERFEQELEVLSTEFETVSQRLNADMNREGALA